MLRIRRAEEAIARLYPSDVIKSPVHLSIGQEAVAVGVIDLLEADDVVAGTYRGHATYLAKGGSLSDMFAEMYDGVLNRDLGYTHRVEGLVWMPGAIDAVRRVNDAGAFAVVVSNQAGIARGLFHEDDVRRFHAEMSRQLARAGAHVDAFMICPYHPDAILDAYRHPSHSDRKPNGGMIVKAMAEWPIDRARAVLIGDRETDIEAARQAGIIGLLSSGSDILETTSSALALISVPAR